MRIVSLVPSISLLLADLGLQDEVVGITKFCVHPASWFAQKTKIGGTKNPHIEKIRALHPTLVFANKEENRKADVEAISGFCKVVVSDIETIDDALNLITDVGKMCHKEAEALALRKAIENSWKFEETMQEIACCYLIWNDPVMTIGGDTFIHHVLAGGGFKNVFGNKERYPEINAAMIKESGAALLLLSSEPFPFKQKHVQEWQQKLPGIIVLEADGEKCSWYGSKLLESAAHLKELRKQYNHQLSLQKFTGRG